jgi:hypothetical protein
MSWKNDYLNENRQYCHKPKEDDNSNKYLWDKVEQNVFQALYVI